jgi:hypothetical protein
MVEEESERRKGGLFLEIQGTCPRNIQMLVSSVSPPCKNEKEMMNGFKREMRARTWILSNLSLPTTRYIPA